MHVSDLRSGRLSARAFAVPSTSDRFRRPTDVVLLTLSLVVIAVTASQVGNNGDFESAFSNWLTKLPQLFDFVWDIVFDFVQIWIVVIAAIALAR